MVVSPSFTPRHTRYLQVAAVSVLRTEERVRVFRHRVGTLENNAGALDPLWSRTSRQ